jgi:broad specificity phosphatase PhoE
MDQGGSDGNDRQVCRIYLVRHARTAMNVQRRFRGRLDVPLDDIGRAEALTAARGLADVGLVTVYTSPLQRARDVAAAIAAEAHIGPPEDLFALVNLEYGAWEGLTRDECGEHDPEAYRLYCDEPEKAVVPGGEALAAAADRVVEGLIEVAGRHPGQSIAAVTHGVMVRLAVLRVAGRVSDDWQFQLATGASTVFEIVDGAPHLVALPNDGIGNGTGSAFAPAVGL